MREFVHQLSSDVRGGRESWRVFLAASVMSFVIAAAHVVVRFP